VYASDEASLDLEAIKEDPPTPASLSPLFPIFSLPMNIGTFLPFPRLLIMLEVKDAVTPVK